MTEEQLDAVRKVRVEADNLRTACVAIAKTGALLHIAYDRDLARTFPIAENVLIGSLRGVQ